MSKVTFPTEAFQTESPQPKTKQAKGNALVKLNNVRLTFPTYTVPKVLTEEEGWVTPKNTNIFVFKVSDLESDNPDPKAKYEAQFIFPVDSENYRRVEAAIKSLANEKWGKTPKELKHCLRDGEDKADEGRSEYKGMAFISAKSTKRPHVLNSKKTPVEKGEEECPYTGCYVDAAIELWTQDHPKRGKAVYASLVGIKFAGDGEPLGGRSYDIDDIF
jgi:hypothetical protein